jgi:DNA repair exonuclease SbcCD ATPase subunit
VLGARLAVLNRRPRRADRPRDRADLLADAQARTAAARTALAGALRDRGIVPEGDLHLATTEYEAACQARAGQAAAAGRAFGLQRELDAARDAEHLAADAARMGAEAEAGLHAALALVAPGSDPDLPTAAVIGRLEAWQAERMVSTEQAEQSIREFQELTGLLNGRSVADLAADAERLEQVVQQLAATVGPHPEIVNGTDESMVAAEVDRLRETAAALSGAADARQADLADVAAAEEAALAAHERLRGVTELAEVIDETLGLLEAAQRQVHRNLAPILATAIREWLPLLSGGAYADAGVNPADLSIEVKERGTGAWRQARLLSGGTREQIYLLLRVAMAEHLVTTPEKAPLLLDEVTAQADNTRERAILDMLLALATDRQLILFTHDDGVLSWAENHLQADRHRIVRLSSPSGQPVDESAEVITVGSGS